MGKVKCILLDCDNTLVQSEKVAFEACCDLTNFVLREKKVDVQFTPQSLQREFVGLSTDEMFKVLQQRHGFVLSDPELDFYVDKEVDMVTDKLQEYVEECPGVTKTLDHLRAQDYPMAVVSTSAISRVVAALDRSGLSRFFPRERVYSATSSLDPPSGKPDPKIYNYACEQLGFQQSECVAVEDSRSGATAAMRAGIPCIAYVGIYGIDEGKEKEDIMAQMLMEQCKCVAVMRDWSEFPEILQRIEAA